MARARKRSRDKREFQDPLTKEQRGAVVDGDVWAALPMREGPPYQPPEPLPRRRKQPSRFARRRHPGPDESPFLH